MSFIFTIVPPFCFKLIHTYIIIFFLIFNIIIFKQIIKIAVPILSLPTVPFSLQIKFILMFNPL
ncbi:hypothetical protein EXW62_13800 [Bacillus mycoides]|nr:hypothetical protein EXW62_13800 [Bacillus mycoides]